MNLFSKKWEDADRSRLLSKDVSEIKSNLYLSSIDPVLSPRTLNSFKIRRIVTLDDTPLDHKLKDITHLFIKIPDSPDADLLVRFEECNRFISEGVANKDNVLVHCVAGVSRSATIVISYLMAEDNLSFEEAMALVRKKRSIVSPNSGFQRQLKLFEKMGRRLDPMNAEFRQYLVENLKITIVRDRPWIGSRYETSFNLLNDYQKRMTAMEEKISDNKRNEVFKCRKCRFCLFSQLNVIKRSNETKEPNVCHSVYIEPLEWMSDYIGQQVNGTINCPKCLSKLGDFSWNGLNCDCDDHKELKSTIIKIDSKKIDSPFIQLFVN